MFTRSVFLSVASLAAFGVHAAAQVILIDQERTVRADSVLVSAPGFGNFDELVQYQGDDCGGMCIADSASSAQNSTITDTIFFADAGCGAAGGSFASTSASTVFVVDFECAEPITLSIEGFTRGSIGGFDPPGWTTGVGSVGLVRVGAGSLAEWSSDGFNGMVQIGPQEIELEPGLYRLEASATGTGDAQDSGGASFNFTITFENTLPCPADLNNDGIADLADVQFFIESFVAGLPAADLNADGLYDLADIQAFVAVFNAGCP